MTDNFKLLLGGRFDIANAEFKDLIAQTSDFKQTEAFSPRVGIVLPADSTDLTLRQL
ncbi:hypothetical protein [Nostoc sp.]|uniref:hypothetical protein n=1 Tax=Nostoc sp. TaxID=1180 RepID=UPI002FF51DC4